MMLTAVLVVALESASLQEGLAALEAARYEEAARLLESAPDVASSYKGLLGLAVARGRLGQLDAAGSPLDAAIRLDPARPEARIERGGLRFLQGRHADAVRDLRVALRSGEDPYARDLLASALLLLERPVEAVEAWNRIGQPRLVRVTVRGPSHTRDHVVRRELRVREGERLDADGLRATILALQETGAFADVGVRASVVKERDVELELLLVERHGFGQPIELATATLSNLLVGRARLRYANLGGRGIGIGAFYRWEGVRPRLDAAVDWPRPFGLPFQWRLAGYRERQPYDDRAETPLRHKARGIDMAFRRVLDGRTVGEGTLHWRRRSFDRPVSFAPPGTLSMIGAGLSRTLFEAPQQRLDAALSGRLSSPTFGSDVAYHAATFSLRYRLGPAESRLVGRALWARGTSRMPLDQMYAPGTAPDGEYPLRGHHLRRNGLLGIAPIGRELRLGNLEWRRELWTGATAGLGFVLFQDVAQVQHPAIGASKVLWDTGIGIRVRVGGTVAFRMDYGRSWGDGASALTIGVGEAF
jgi:hypothetical protein